MNYALVDTVQDLLTWPRATGRDTYGTYTIITGYEGTGACFWCGADLEGQRRRFCGHRSGHWTEYARHFYWSYARDWCIERAGHTCENCGQKKEVHRLGELVWLARIPLEVHHIIPLDAGPRAVTPWNLPWNLICLCHDCHQEIHAVLRPPPKGRPNRVSIALGRGQLPMGDILGETYVQV